MDPQPDYMEPRLNERFPIKSPKQISPPSVKDPIHECAKVVHIYGFVPHAIVTVYANGTEVVGKANPYVGYADIPLTRELQFGEKITATQSFYGMTSLQSYVPVVVQHNPTTLNKPKVGKDIYDCGHIVLVDGLVPSVHVQVFQNPTTPTVENPSTLIGEADAPQSG